MERGFMMGNELLANLDKIHTTELGAKRIAKNLGLGDIDALLWCKDQMANPDSITRAGKNWYVRGDGFVITVNCYSFTVITEHREKVKKGSDMSGAGIIKKLDDIPALKEKLIQIFDAQTHRDISEYGLLLVKHIFLMAQMQVDEAVEACSSVNRRWRDGLADFREARDVAGRLLDAAREEKNSIREKALRVIAQVAAIPHVERHALIASDYAVKLINIMFPGDMEEARKEREIQIKLMESV